MSPKTVHWHPSVKNKEYDWESTPMGYKSTQYAYVEQASSSVSSLETKRARRPRPELTPSEPTMTRVFLKSKEYPDPSSSEGAKTVYRVRSGSSSKNAAPRLASSKAKRERPSLPVMNVGASYDQVLYPSPKASSPLKASSPSKRSSKSSSPREQKAEISVLPWVPDAPNLLEVPSTPRPRRLPTPDLPPIDPRTFYPQPIKPYNDTAIAPGPAELRQDIKIARAMEYMESVRASARGVYIKDASA